MKPTIATSDPLLRYRARGCSVRGTEWLGLVSFRLRPTQLSNTFERRLLSDSTVCSTPETRDLDGSEHREIPLSIRRQIRRGRGRFPRKVRKAAQDHRGRRPAVRGRVALRPTVLHEPHGHGKETQERPSGARLVRSENGHSEVGNRRRRQRASRQSELQPAASSAPRVALGFSTRLASAERCRARSEPE